MWSYYWSVTICTCNILMIDSKSISTSNAFRCVPENPDKLLSEPRPMTPYGGISQSLQWRHNGHDSVSSHQPHDCLLNRLFRRRSKKTSNLRVTDLCAGNSPGTGEFPGQMASNTENVSIWWRHHDIDLTQWRAWVSSFEQIWAWILTVASVIELGYALAFVQVGAGPLFSTKALPIYKLILTHHRLNM